MLAAALANFFDTDSGKVFGDAVEGSVIKEIIDGMVLAGFCSFPAGAVEYTYTVTSSGTGLPVADVQVWFTTDLGGANVIWTGYTDAFGVARDQFGNKPFLDAGIYFVWKQRVGYTPAEQPDTENVSP
jgi:hypothetical protein